jgi:hypothetical protein
LSAAEPIEEVAKRQFSLNPHAVSEKSGKAERLQRLILDSDQVSQPDRRDDLIAVGEALARLEQTMDEKPRWSSCDSLLG